MDWLIAFGVGLAIIVFGGRLMAHSMAWVQAIGGRCGVPFGYSDKLATVGALFSSFVGPLGGLLSIPTLLASAGAGAASVLGWGVASTASTIA